MWWLGPSPWSIGDKCRLSLFLQNQRKLATINTVVSHIFGLGESSIYKIHWVNLLPLRLAFVLLQGFNTMTSSEFVSGQEVMPWICGEYFLNFGCFTQFSVYVSVSSVFYLFSLLSHLRLQQSQLPRSNWNTMLQYKYTTKNELTCTLNRVFTNTQNWQ